jgi:ATP synthase in type III secretion protein N
MNDPAMKALVAELDRAIGHSSPVTMRGRVGQAVGLTIDATGIQARIGELCELVTPGEASVWAEVVGFRHNTALLTPLGPMTGLSMASEVLPTGRGLRCPVGPGLLGRVLDALGNPIDGGGPRAGQGRMPVHREAVAPLARRPVQQPFVTGLSAIDGLMTLGVGQRIGVFAPPGVGKSTLLGMLARGSNAQVNVIALVGERGREVQEFIQQNLGPAGLARSVIVVSTSDRPAMERIKCAQVATTMAEYFRDQGQSVLLLVDSLTRFARAQREVGLASGEPPTRRSYPPSVFSVLPQLLERAGQGTQGSITAVYAVLTEGEDDSDPIAEEVRSIVDGHLVLSRRLAEAGQFPAIDVLASVSRVMGQVTDAAHRADAALVRKLLSRHRELELLLQIGEYKPGQDALSDRAVRAFPALQAFLAQGTGESVALTETLAALRGLCDGAKS